MGRIRNQFCLCVFLLLHLFRVPAGHVPRQHSRRSIEAKLDDFPLNDFEPKAEPLLDVRRLGGASLHGRLGFKQRRQRSQRRRALEATLHDYLLKDCDPDARPIFDEGQSVDVSLSVTLENFVVKESEESVTLLLTVLEMWSDAYLSWDPKRFGGLTKTFVNEKKVWKPNGNFINAFVEQQSSREPIAITSDGMLAYKQYLAVTVRCPLNMRYFPWDHHECFVEFASSWYHGAEVSLRLVDCSAQMENFRNSSWSTVEFKADKVLIRKTNSTGPMFEKLVFTLLFLRDATFFKFILLAPAITIISLSVLSVLLPKSFCKERVDKINIGVSTLFTLSVLIGVVTNSLPPTSVGLPLLAIYVLIELAISTLSILGSGLLTLGFKYSIYKKRSPPDWLHKLTSCFYRPNANHFEKLLMEPLPLSDNPIVSYLLLQYALYLESLKKQEDDELLYEKWNHVFSVIESAISLTLVVLNILVCVYIFWIPGSAR